MNYSGEKIRDKIIQRIYRIERITEYDQPVRITFIVGLLIIDKVILYFTKEMIMEYRRIFNN